MTFRAVVLGILGAALIAAVGYINDEVLLLNPLVANHLPIIVFGPLVVFMLLGNPFLFRLRPR